MSRQFGSDGSIFQTLATPLTDNNGMTLVDTSSGFGASPLGISLREQIQFGLPNASFNLLPPDPEAQISDYDNPLPYWSIQTTPSIGATAVYDTATGTWGIKLDPGTAASGEYLALKTRSWVTTDDNLALRQKASLTLSKNGTYAGTTQYNVTLLAEYFTHANVSLGTTTIGTALDNATMTSISGFTTAGGSAIPSSAAWAEFTIKLTTTATVSSSTSVTLKSLLLATSSATGGSFVVVDTFTSSGTWTRPTGVTSIYAVIGVGAGGGGGGAGFALRSSTSQEDANGAPGGAGAAWIQVKDIDVTGVSDISVGIGAGGAGGAGKGTVKAAGGTAQYSGTAFFNANSGSPGATTTFGTYITITGGEGGTAGRGVGGSAGVATAPAYWDLQIFTGGTGSVFTTSTGVITGAGTSAAAPYTLLYTVANAGSAGANAVYTINGTAQALDSRGTGAAGGSAGIGGGGGCGAGYNASYPPTAGRAGGGGGGGGALDTNIAPAGTAGTIVFTGGNGGTPGANSGGGGGGGGAAMLAISGAAAYNGREVTVWGGTGAKGSDGAVYVVYVA